MRGNDSLSSCNRLASRSRPRLVYPVALPPGRDVDGNAGLLARALVSAVAAVRAGDGRGGDDENDVAALGCLAVRAAAHAPARAIGNRIEIGRI